MRRIDSGMWNWGSGRAISRRRVMKIGTAIKNGFKGRLYDAFPAENIEFQVIGP